MRKLRRLRFQKLLPCRSIKEQVANRDGRAFRQPRLFHARHLATIDLDHRAGRRFFGRFHRRARFQPQARHRRDRGQRFPAKSQRGDAQQILRLLEFRRGMPLEREHGIVAHHAASVVRDLNKLLPARLNRNLDAGRARVERVLEQFLYHRRRTLHHLAGGDFIGDLLRKYVNAAHRIESSAQLPVESR